MDPPKEKKKPFDTEPISPVKVSLNLITANFTEEIR
jgi:hypothetical protein